MMMRLPLDARDCRFPPLPVYNATHPILPPSARRTTPAAQLLGCHGGRLEGGEALGQRFAMLVHGVLRQAALL